MPNNDQPMISVVHIDPFTGILLEPTPPFERYNTIPNQNSVNFDVASDANKYCHDTVASHPPVQCVVNGLPLGSQCDFGDPAWVEAESKRRTQQNALDADNLARRHRRERLLIAAFVLTALTGAALYVLTQIGGYPSNAHEAAVVRFFDFLRASFRPSPLITTVLPAMIATVPDDTICQTSDTLVGFDSDLHWLFQRGTQR